MKKGFTLIELLAVIVILAIIALIATPVIINIINDSQKSAATNSAQLYVDGLMKRIVSENMNGEFNPSSCTISNGNITCDGQALDYTVDGDKPTSGSITFNNGIVTGYTLVISGYTVTKNGSIITTVKGEPEPIEFNGTYVAGGQNDTYIGIAYLDPTDLSATCTAQLAAQNLNDESTPTPTGITSGCMKFYVYADDGTNYSMILDHNTTANIEWVNWSDYVGAGGTEDSELGEAVKTNFGAITVNSQLLLDTAGWVGNPRLISAAEIAHITGADVDLKWDMSKEYVACNYYHNDAIDIETQYSCYFFDGSGSSYDDWDYDVSPDYSGISNYGWLTDYTYYCSGCGDAYDANEDYGPEGYSHILGYWMSDSIPNSRNAFAVILEAGINVEDADSYNHGIRPVITLPKSIFE